MGRVGQLVRREMDRLSGQGGGDEREGWTLDEAVGGEILKLVNSEAIGLQVPEAEYKVLFLQFTCGLRVTVDEAQFGHVARGVGRGVEMAGNQKV
eukprot:g28496.t1